MEAAAVDDAGNEFALVKLHPVVGRDDAQHFVGVVVGWLGIAFWQVAFRRGLELRNDLAANRDGVGLIVSRVVDRAGYLGV